LTIRDLAERSGVSVRFLIQLESGRGNISVKRLADLAHALDIPTADLLRDDEDGQRRTIALLGLRGAEQKTTIGKQLARALHVHFVELDRRIEKAADMSLAEIFSLYGDESTIAASNATCSRTSFRKIVLSCSPQAVAS
jgi:XRE family aerobic/anaerobic benzoate catabolism transcriptional regulator